jgi:hypothetical protein
MIFFLLLLCGFLFPDLRLILAIDFMPSMAEVFYRMEKEYNTISSNYKSRQYKLTIADNTRLRDISITDVSSEYNTISFDYPSGNPRDVVFRDQKTFEL